MIIPITYCVSPHMRMRRSSSRIMKAQNWVNYSACELLICEAAGVAKRPHVKSLQRICISPPAETDHLLLSRLWSDNFPKPN